MTDSPQQPPAIEAHSDSPYRIMQELRAPLSAIAGLSETLADRLDDSEEAGTARLIAASCERLVQKLDSSLNGLKRQAP